MTDTAHTDNRLAEAYELGCSRGWSHANFVDAYGREHERNTPDYPAWMITDPRALPDGAYDAIPYRERQQRKVWQAEFKRGWTDGRRRFHHGQYPDGSKIED